MSTEQNIGVISDIYAAYGRGDVEGILSRCTDDVLWRTHLDPIVPWSGNYDGKENARRFFTAIAESVDVTGFEPIEWVAEGDTVVSMGSFSCIARSTGKSSDSPWIFIWKLRDGLVYSYEQFHDHEIADAFR